jgi:hypothetical protein
MEVKNNDTNDIHILKPILELNEFDKVIGHIYKIINLVNNKHYIGQTRSHRLNRKKYRSFGYVGRFKDHISEAKSTSKKNQCTFLNNAILKYGVENFKVELIITCNINELDYYEVKYISEYNSKYPNGYNLTNGGQTKTFKKCEKIILADDEKDLNKSLIKKDIKIKKHSDYTKELMSKRIKEHLNKPENKLKQMINVQKQHYKQKFERFKDEKIDRNNIDQYIKIAKNNKENYSYVQLKINNKEANFVGKLESIEVTKERARMFIFDLLKWQDTLLLELP